MKNKSIVAGLAMALGLAALSSSAQAQVGGAPASGDVGSSSGNYGNYGQTDYLNTGRQAFQTWDRRTQNYVSPQTMTPASNDHAANQTPYVREMMDADSHGLNMVSTAPMAPGTTSIGNTPFPSGQFTYGFRNNQIDPYHGAYGPSSPNFRMGGMLPNVSTGSVDFNTVDMSGVAPAGMISPGRGMAAPIGRPIVTIPVPSQSASTTSVYDWLNNTFFGP